MTSAQIQFSIIIATYNSEKTLIRCINSIIEQNFKNYELIIIDGGSTDGTVNIIKQFDSNISSWISEKDKGIYDAWNKGVRMAKGEWITFVGSDDSLYFDALSNYHDFIRSLNNPRLEFVSSKLDLVDVNNNYIKTLGLPWDWESCRRQNLIAHPGSLHNRLLFEKFGLFDDSYRICGDFEFLLRPGKEFKTAFMDKITVRMSQGGVSFNAGKLFTEHYRAVVSTGKLNKPAALFYYRWQMAKSYIKSGIRKLGVNI
ncbi:MAG: glycosyl transferase family 2 [Mucilaginibacter sp.]|nr:glycosyl transferase family 2 [Mucilaginibacter sp.]